jgi:hypothetical protein
VRGPQAYRGRVPVPPAPLLRTAVVALVLVLLLRAARAAWGRRDLALRVWRAIRPRHVLGSVALLAVVLATMLGLLVLAPVTGYGLGDLVGLEGNVVFAPIDGALDAPAAPPAGGADAAPPGVPWVEVLGVTAFLAALVALFPHLAHAEEQAFRAGWEDLPPYRQVLSALRFGLAHLVMLIPLAAALAVAVAGFAYGRVYRRSYRRAAVRRWVVPAGRRSLLEDEQGSTRLVLGPPSPVPVVDRAAARRQAVFDAAVWHTTFNTLVALVVWVGYLTAAAVAG